MSQGSSRGAVAPPAATIPPAPSRWAEWIAEFTPKSVICWREGYTRQAVVRDVVAGLTVAVVALPLSLALAIGSGLKPEQGLYAAIIGGILISLFGGSRVQIGGPAGAFMIIVAGIVGRHGYEGLAICTLMAGLMLIIMAFLRVGSLIKFVPYPVVTGFTSGIAVIIFSQEIKDFFGLQLAEVPTSFVAKWAALLGAIHTTSLLALSFGGSALLVMIALRRYWPRVPGAIVVVVISALLTGLLGLDAAHFNGGLETLGTRFGGIPSGVPHPQFPIPLGSWPDLVAAWHMAVNLIPEAATIAVLGSIESLLCAVVADGMIGGRHKSNSELLGQGLGNIGSILFGGMPTTGVIARTAVNIKSGGRTPLAGLVHSLTLLVLMVLLAPYASAIPLSVLAAILMMVAWNMAELDHFRSLLRAPRADAAVLLATFGLTVLTDLTVGVGVGMALAAVLFIKRMSEVTNLSAVRRAIGATDETPQADAGDPIDVEAIDVPPGVEIYEINGPFFFGVADRLKDTLRMIGKPPLVFILRMRRVSALDASGLHALEEFWNKCRRQDTRLILAGVHTQPMIAMRNYGLIDRIGEENLAGTMEAALEAARATLGKSPSAETAAATSGG